MKLTPRQRLVLMTRLCVNADGVYDDVAENSDAPVGTSDTWWMVLDQFPPCTWELGRSWRRDAARAFDDLAGDLEHGGLPRPRSLAEQLALMLSLAEARDAMADHAYGPDVEELPEHPTDGDWDAVEDELLEDRDIEGFYSPSATEISAWLAIAPPQSWFSTLPGATPRDPARGYRR